MKTIESLPKASSSDVLIVVGTGETAQNITSYVHSPHHHTLYCNYFCGALPLKTPTYQLVMELNRPDDQHYYFSVLNPQHVISYHKSIPKINTYFNSQDIYSFGFGTRGAFKTHWSRGDVKLDYAQRSSYVALQLAVYMQYRTVILLGLDGGDSSGVNYIYDKKVAHFVEEENRQLDILIGAIKTCKDYGMRFFAITKSDRLRRCVHGKD